ncbi:MAG: GIY-YIG nuclease family protein, partial [Candidatus Hydrogenedens sp.]
MSQNKLKDTILNTLVNIDKIPASPGCYIFYDDKNKVIYVGKANNLKSRIRSYLQNTDARYHVRFLISKAKKIDYMVTNTERESLLLENTLIKQYKPRYNIRLKDDKNYLSLRIDPSEDFPRLTFTRQPKKDNAVYFGPFHSASIIRDAYKHLHFIIPLRRCSDNNFRNRTRPCLYYELGTCLAPCVQRISREQYSELVQQAILLLQGKTDVLEQEFLQQIKRLSDELQFEQAGMMRDRL